MKDIFKKTFNNIRNKEIIQKTQSLNRIKLTDLTR